jgi:replicative DNA helicase
VNLPSAVDAEKSVLAAVLLHPPSFAEIGDLVTADDFHHPAHRAIFEAILALDQAQKPIDAVTLVAEMTAQDTLTKLRGVSGSDYIVELQNSLASMEGLRHHAQVIATKSQRRACAVALQGLLRDALDPAMGDTDFIAHMERQLSAVADARRESGGPRALRPVLKEVVKSMQLRYEARQRGEQIEITGAPTPWGRLNHMLGGLQDGKLYVIGARPKMGKTAAAINIVDSAAAAGWHGLVFSLEMEDQELVTRLLASDARVDSKAIERADLEQKHWARLIAAGGRLSERPIWIDSQGDLTFDEIRSRARRWRRRFTDGKKALIVVDYLQLISGAGEEENRQQEITRISRGLKALSKELKCPVLALSQLNRGLENRDDKRPRASDLRESGAIEQDADVIAFIYRDEVYHSPDNCEQGKRNQCDRCSANAGEAEFIVNGHRGGETGAVPLKWFKQFTRFEAQS